MKNQLRVALATTLAITAAPFVAAAQPAEDDGEIECPDFIRGAKLQFSESAHGMSLTITTPSPQHVPQLRLALEQTAHFLENRATNVSLEQDPTARIPPVAIAVRPISAGMQVIVRARNATDVALLRRQGRMLELMWQHSECINGEARMPTSVST